MKPTTLTLILPFIIISLGCAGPQPRNTPAPVDDTDIKHLEHQLSPTLKKSEARVYPYKANSAITTIPIVTRIESPIETSSVEPIEPTEKAAIKVTSLATTNKKLATKPNTNKLALASNTSNRKINTAPKPRSKNQPTKPRVQVATITKPIVSPPVTPVAALLQQAATQHATGDLVKAAATLERGVRIEPRNPHLWNKLARIRLEQGLFNQAQNMAAKSNSMASDSPQLLQENQRIISEANKRAGH